MPHSPVRPDPHSQAALNHTAGSTPVKPIFFDPANKRWPRLRLGISLIVLLLTLLLGALILSILASPVLPTLNLPGVSFLPHGIHSVPGVPPLSPERPPSLRERALRNAKTKLAHERERNLQQLLAKARKTPMHPSKQQLAVGFFVNWDD